MSIDNTTLFRKLKLVPAEEPTNRPSMGEVTKYLRKYDPTLHAMANSYVGMSEALIGKKKGRTTSNKLNLYNSNKARYLQLLNSATNSAALPPPPSMSEGPVRVEEPEEQEMKASAVGLEDMDDKKFKPEAVPLLAIPTASHGKFKAVMEQAGDAIKPGRNGELVIQGKALPGTSFSDVMRALYVTRKVNPPGFTQTVSELKRLGVPAAKLKSKTAVALYKKVQPEQTGSGRFKKFKASGKARSVQKKVLRLY
jgi:hypothetical protein